MKSNPLVIDANLLVLFVVGCASRGYISHHKRLKKFSDEDFDLLFEIISRASSVLVTPNTLTETSNLAVYGVEGRLKEKILELLREFVLKTEEQYLSSNLATGHPAFVRLGLTDATLLEVIKNSACLLTVDLDLYLAAMDQGANAVNFNHLKDMTYADATKMLSS